MQPHLEYAMLTNPIANIHHLEGIQSHAMRLVNGRRIVSYKERFVLGFKEAFHECLNVKTASPFACRCVSYALFYKFSGLGINQIYHRHIYDRHLSHITPLPIRSWCSSLEFEGLLWQSLACIASGRFHTLVKPTVRRFQAFCVCRPHFSALDTSGAPQYNILICNLHDFTLRGKATYMSMWWISIIDSY